MIPARAALVVTLACSALAAEPPVRQQPESPRAWVDAQPSPRGGRTIEVRRPDGLQRAIDTAGPGDVIVLNPGTAYEGPITLPAKEGAGWIVIRTSGSEGGLPLPGVRAGPADAPAMARIVAARGPVILAGPGAHHYRLVGLEIAPLPGDALASLVEIGGDEDGRSSRGTPHHIIIERCWIHGDARKGSGGIVLNGSHLAIIETHVSAIGREKGDACALAAHSGPGPYKIANNHLEAAGSVLRIGGGRPEGAAPADVEIRRNRIGRAAVAGRGGGSERSLVEIRGGRRVLIEGNLIDHGPSPSRGGFAITLGTRGREPATVPAVSDVTFVHNIVRHARSAMGILGRHERGSGAGIVEGILIRCNLFDEVGARSREGQGALLERASVVDGVVMVGNTTSHPHSPVMVEEPPAAAAPARRLSAATGSGADLQRLCAAMAPGDRPAEVCARRDGPSGGS